MRDVSIQTNAPTRTCHGTTSYQYRMRVCGRQTLMSTPSHTLPLSRRAGVCSCGMSIHHYHEIHRVLSKGRTGSLEAWKPAGYKPAEDLSYTHSERTSITYGGIAPKRNCNCQISSREHTCKIPSYATALQMHPSSDVIKLQTGIITIPTDGPNIAA